jgi:hypothetical protein
MSTAFIPGIKLCEDFYRKVVRPILMGYFPDLKHAAALLGSGSEVLGFDDEVSTDHHWGPRVMLFVEEARQQYLEQIIQVLAQNLPYEFQGYPTNYTRPDPNDHGTQLLQKVNHGPVNHRITVQTVRDFFVEYLGFDIWLSVEPADWLTFPEQRLRSITSGAIYHDDVGLAMACSDFSYYPRDVWLYLLAAGWARIGQEEHLMGRMGMVGDEVGSAVIGARLVRDIMRLCFLMERTYAPYPKWFGSAFKKLSCAKDLWPILQNAVHAEAWQKREVYLVNAYEYIAVWHNSLGLTEPLPETAIPFFGRPFKVIALHGYADALLRQIEDPAVKQIAARPLIGGIDMLSDNTDFVSDPLWRPLVRQLYQ